MRIGIDAMGGDFAPKECIKAVLTEANTKDCDMQFFVFGEQSALAEYANDLQHPKITVIFTGESIGMGEHATKAVASKKESSINVGMSFLAEDKIDAFLGAGNTGAMMVSALYQVKTISGIERPALSSVLPQQSGTTGVLLDVGANSDLKPETLAKFATLGSEYAKAVYGIKNPRVGLVNIGEEEEKGNILTKSAFPLLKNQTGINFIGNVEGRHLFNDLVDVAVCDGFTGNVIVKTCEGFFYNLLKRGVEDDFLTKFNFEHYGGTPILGIKKPVIVGHGITKAKTFRNMIKLAKNVVDSELISKIEQSFSETTSS
ncbi:MAG: phosphate acyltransferase PlsX [Bacteroidia bacterium]|jgi:glycerol-3-phosphate acyltransferase PlsX|nr:phosphate acyltransferase PlsX [Bacteroidia bacterium]